MKRVGLVLVLALMMATHAANAADTIVVTPDAINEWWFFQETPTGSGTFVSGPATPSLGSGSAQLTINGTGGEIFGTVAFVGTRLDAITSLGYSTYRTSGSAALVPSLQLDIDTDVTDGNTAWQGRLVYEPYYTHTVSTGVWQAWNPLDNAGTGNWWFTGAPGNTRCTIGNPCTWTELRTHFPNAGIRSAGSNTGALQFKAGGGWTSGFVGSVDALSIGVNSVVTTYDFELVTPTVLPTPTPISLLSHPATINVVTTVVNDNGGTMTIGDFPLFVNGTPVISGATNIFPVISGVYTITETGNSHYARSFSGDCDFNGQVNLSAGSNKFCIITNDDVGVLAGIPPIPPLIDVVKVPSPLALPNGPGPVTYTYTLHNVGMAPVTDITMVGDTCSPITLVSGDTNSDSILQTNETWIFTCGITLSETHTNTVVAVGRANGISTVDIATATVVVGVPGFPETGLIVPPLIHVTKIPNPLTLFAGGGLVTYTEKITNPGGVALRNITLTDDTCAPMRYLSGDSNNDDKLDITETWIYTCSANLTATSTNTAVATGEVNGLTVRDFASATVVVTSLRPPNRPLSIGMQGDDVVALQIALVQKGFLIIPPGIAKGYFGILTRTAVAKYQTRVGLPSMGTFGPLTRAKLFVGLTQ